MQKITSFFTNEYHHFNRLNNQGQKLIVSIFLYNLISPLLGVFINAFLWRQAHDITLVAFYNLIEFIGVPIGFYLNGKLLRKLSPRFLYILGLLIMGTLATVLIFLANITFPIVFIFGLFFGIGVGIFWANRNLLTLKTTQSNNRIYFSSLESASGNIADIFVPLCIGWFIILGASLHWYSAVQGYQILALLMLLAIAMIALALKNFHITLPKFSQIFLRSESTNWHKFRLLQFILGLLSGMSGFVPTLMVLTLLGKENALGTVQSGAAIVGAVVIYAFGKILQTQHRIKVFQASFFLELLAAGIFSLFYSGIGVLLFFILDALAQPFSWMAISSLNYDLIDKENKTENNHYAHLFDQELYLNAGRIVAIACFLFFATYFSKAFAVRFSPLLFAFLQLFLLLIAKSIEKHKT